MDEACAICKESSSETLIVGDKGRRTLVSSSLERGDGFHDLFEKATPLRIHELCRKQYTRKSSILSVKRKSTSDEDDEVPVLRSRTSEKFDLKTHCIFCSESVFQDSKVPFSRRQAVSNVETLEFKTSVLNKARERNDDWGTHVSEHIQEDCDLVAAGAKYHRQCAVSFFRTKDKEESSEKNLRQRAFDKLCEFLEDSDECQYSLLELSIQMAKHLDGNEGYTLKHLRKKLEQHYGDDIVVTSTRGQETIVSFRDSADKILYEKWDTDKLFDVKTKNDRIIDMAASIIRNDIRLEVYDCDEYTTLEGTNNGETLIPSSLKRFLHKVLDGNGKSHTVSERKCTSIAHALISACRPRSFISPLLLGIAVYIHRKYASRELIDILSSLSYSDDYREVQRLEHALISGEPSYQLDGFTQFVFDNADFNVATVSGHNTFHSLGGIACVTPSGTKETSPVKRKVKLPSSEFTPNFGSIPVKTYRKPSCPGLQSVTVAPLENLDHPIQSLRSAAALDCLWVVGQVLELAPCPLWSGYMKTVMQDGQYEQTRIETLPFINMQPSDPSTIYTALCFAQQLCQRYRLRMCTVTFDQPLYIKAAEIVASSSQDLDRMVVRLGGFHLLMSYLGSIGHMMSGSGLEELWQTTYAKGSVMNMLTGHAFSRALRAHILSSAALITVLMEKPGVLDCVDKGHLENLYRDLLNHNQTTNDVDEDECVKQLRQVISDLLHHAESQSRTGKLWVQYIRQVALLQHFIRAERTGDWKLHLSCVREMIPYFHAAGHLPYAKSARLYLQQMEGLEKTMGKDEYSLFAEQGYFTIRRQDSYWSGNFSDQTIEQFLMRSFKGSGGMTHGRGISDSTLTKWVHALPRCAPICDALEQFTGVHTGTSEQHKDMRQSAQSKDMKDRQAFVGWLRVHPPFAGYEPDRLVSISTGIVADSTANCEQAVEIGLRAASAVSGKSFTDMKLHRTDKVRTIGEKEKMVTVRGQNVDVNPGLLFNRITCVLHNSSEMSSFLAYELAPQPPSLFQDGLMRKPVKSSLGLLLKSFTQPSKLPENCIYVLDGGHLLQSVVWPQQSIYAEVCQSYIDYITKHYGPHPTVVFDGYGSKVSTKAAEQRRRAQKCTSSDVIFTDDMPTTTTQAAFLGNSNNKKRLIQSLHEKMVMAGIRVKQAEADADTLIVTTALALANSKALPVVVVGTDTDLLVLLVAQASTTTDMYMLCSTNPVSVFSIREIQDALGDTKDHIMFLHAVTGCDTVSAIYRQGKRKAFNMVHKKRAYDMLDTFTDKESTHDEVNTAGEAFILKLYGARKVKSLDEFRHITYKRAIGRSSLSSSFNLASLPPTTAASKQHSYRTYLTVQEWMGNSLSPTEWGWRWHDRNLVPVESDIPFAPDTLLNMVSCGCKEDGCSTRMCSCKKLGLFCSSMCSKCSGQSCSNTAPADVSDDEDDL